MCLSVIPIKYLALKVVDRENSHLQNECTKIRRAIYRQKFNITNTIRN